MDFQKTDSLATRASLLERLKDLEDQDSWQQFYTTYRRLIFGFATKHGLSGTEAEEVVQETVITVARNMPEFRYDPKRCSFKTWLFNLTLWRIQDQIRKRRPEDTPIHRKPGQTDRTGTVERLPGPESERVAAIWEEEWKKDLFARALEKVRAEFRGEAINAANSPIFTAPNTVPTSSAFGRVTSVAWPGRQWQFALKVRF